MGIASDILDHFPKELLLTAHGRAMYVAALRAKLLADCEFGTEESEEDPEFDEPTAKRRCLNPITGSVDDEESEEHCDYSDEYESESTIPTTLELITIPESSAPFDMQLEALEKMQTKKAWFSKRLAQKQHELETMENTMIELEHRRVELLRRLSSTTESAAQVQLDNFLSKACQSEDLASIAPILSITLSKANITSVDLQKMASGTSKTWEEAGQRMHLPLALLLLWSRLKSHISNLSDS